MAKNRSKNRGKNNSAESRRRTAERRASTAQNASQAPQSRYRVRNDIHPDMRLIGANMDKLSGKREYDLMNFILNQYHGANEAGDSVRQVEEWIFGLGVSSRMADSVWVPDSYGQIVNFQSDIIQRVVACFELTSLDKEYAL